MNVRIRLEQPEDYRTTEAVTREAFWNLYVPGCDEHYLLHVMRGHPDFYRELDFVAENDSGIVGNIVYARSFVEAKDGERVDTISFGPISVKPEYQRKGIGSLLIEHTRRIVAGMKIPAVIIFGHPYNYVKHGFVSGRKYNIGVGDNKYPTGLLVMMMDETPFIGKEWVYHGSDAYDFKPDDAEKFDALFPQKAKAFQPSQEDFWITSHSFIESSWPE